MRDSLDLIWEVKDDKFCHSRVEAETENKYRACILKANTERF